MSEERILKAQITIRTTDGTGRLEKQVEKALGLWLDPSSFVLEWDTEPAQTVVLAGVLRVPQ